MTITEHAPAGLTAAAVASLTARHLSLLTKAETLACGLQAGMSVPEAIAALRLMSAEARS